MPSVWEEEVTEAVLEFPEDTRVGCRVSSGRTRVGEDRDVEVQGFKGEEGGPGPP